MKRMSHLIYLSLCILVVYPASGQRVLKNLIPNPSFEYMDPEIRREVPEENWNFVGSDESVTGHTTTSRSVDRFRSFLIRAEEGTGTLTSEKFVIERGGRHIFSFAVSGSGSLTVSVLWWNLSGADTVLVQTDIYDPITVADSWGVIEYEAWVPRRGKSASVQFELGGGSAWIDDVRFRRLP